MYRLVIIILEIVPNHITAGTVEREFFLDPFPLRVTKGPVSGCGCIVESFSVALGTDDEGKFPGRFPRNEPNPPVPGELGSKAAGNGKGVN